MNEDLFIKVKREIRKTEKSGNYNNLIPLAYSDNLTERFALMGLVLASDTLDASELYGDDISYYFATYDLDGNVVNMMPYEQVKFIADKLLKNAKYLQSYQKAVNFIVNNYFPSPEEFRNSMVK